MQREHNVHITHTLSHQDQGCHELHNYNSIRPTGTRIAELSSVPDLVGAQCTVHYRHLICMDELTSFPPTSFFLSFFLPLPQPIGQITVFQMPQLTNHVTHHTALVEDHDPPLGP